ncbi:MAG: aminodeoxychorismate synthase component I [Proteobacteria bacterium]|nr:aminodeoxychorismate synthase component I [Pseudomonadota bacterium]
MKIPIFPLVKEIDYVCPITVFAGLPQNNAILLDSACQENQQGQYSFIALDPFLIMTCQTKVTLGDETFSADPFEVLADSLKKYPLERLNDLPPFQGGVAGMLGYELGTFLEDVPKSQRDDLQFPELILGFYDLVIAWDHKQKRAFLFSSGYPLQNSSERESRAKARLAWLEHELSQISPLQPLSKFAPCPIISTFTQETYQAAVRRVIEYILAGDIFEANISQRFSSKLPGVLPFDLYRLLRLKNPAPFAAFMQYKEWTIASTSPERFLKLSNHSAQARPIKGTSPRCRDKLQDEKNAKALLASEKDRAENVMIVDLMRNDLSKVCLPGSVKVSQLCGLESFATVHHLVSVIEGQLKQENNAIDLIKATFPGGSITGAPKIRAMEIIAQIEPTVRGPYCGSMGYIGFNGDMDLSITIRTLLMNAQMLSFQTGGAITLGSDPCAEYEETLAKAKVISNILMGDLAL